MIKEENFHFRIFSTKFRTERVQDAISPPTTISLVLLSFLHIVLLQALNNNLVNNDYTF